MYATKRLVLAILAWPAFVVGSTAVVQAEDLPSLLERARSAIADNHYEEAILLFRDADKLATGQCLECHISLAVAYNRIGASKDAARSARRALEHELEPRLEAKMHNQLGLALFKLAGDDEKELAAAAAAFETVLALTGSQEALPHFNLANVRLKQERDDEARDLLETYLKLDPAGPYVEQARALIAEPRRGRELLVPDFSTVTLGGTFLTAKELRGKVVLLDFWGTWCAPCVAAIPSLRRLSRRNEERPFVLISISSDQDKSLLEQFIDDNDMHWPQIWGRADHELSRMFEVRSYPTYILIDHEGVIKWRLSGWSRGLEQKISREVGRAIRVAKKSP